MLTIKEIASGIKNAIVFHGKKDPIWLDYQVKLNESNRVTINQLYDDIEQQKNRLDRLIKEFDISRLPSKPDIPTESKSPKALKLKAEEEIIKEQDIELTQEELHEMLEYRDGDLYWKISPNKRLKVGDRAGTKGSYLRKSSKEPIFQYVVRYKGTGYPVSRLVFKMFHGWLPEIVQCIDGDAQNTTIENLRAVNNSQAHYRSKKMSTNTSGYKGVYSVKGKWVAQISQHRKVKHLGTFDDPKEAHKAYKKAAKKLYGKFANFG